MQELRFVLIIVGGLAIAALLFHGLWTSKKEGKSKFGERPLRKIDVDQDESSSVKEGEEDEREINFAGESSNADDDPLIGSFNADRSDADVDAEPVVFNSLEEDDNTATEDVIQEHHEQTEPKAFDEPLVSPLAAEEPVIEPEPEEEQLEVLVLNVHCAGNEPFVGTKLFDSMQQNGLLYGEMNIFHRHADLSGTGKVLFSVANMMQPGTLEHDDPDTFTTKGISFFMTLPCFGEPEQNFKLMLKTAQQIADDMGGNVLDDARNLMTPNRLEVYRQQIRDFKSKTSAKG
ncbi:cell division protein ZipA [Vibrio nitrifigilis]|uniref:Cell division protein ZipA n=1 Tax=Vibrio nitrifigilis TaxID=2789781 RepID=A0ABS0GBL9_9VIBR|nr:cell division protein ZipA [Vibrio nitrifigilis]MBF8999804.1 cell division protein ZipA [Vibrio nitrifigilis]